MCVETLIFGAGVILNLIPSVSREVRSLLRTRDGQATGLRDGQSLLHDRTGDRERRDKEEKRMEKKETENDLIIIISGTRNSKLESTTQINVAVKE